MNVDDAKRSEISIDDGLWSILQTEADASLLSLYAEGNQTQEMLHYKSIE